MPENKDIRWKQRYANFKKALRQLQKFIDKGELSELEKQGLVKAFEYTYLPATGSKTGRNRGILISFRSM